MEEKVENMNLDKSFWSEVLQVGIRNIWLYSKVQVKIIGLTYILLTLGLWFIGYGAWSLLIALGISILDIVPVIGAGIAFVPWIIWEWIAGTASQGWWLLLLYIGVEAFKQLIEPYILGKDMQLPFWVPFFITIGCGLIFNIFGIVAAALIIPFLSAYRQVRKTYDK